MKKQSIRRLLKLKPDPDSLHPPPINSSGVGPTSKSSINTKSSHFAFRGLGCATSSSQAVSPPESSAAAAVRTAADWHSRKASRRPHYRKRGDSKKGGAHHAATSSGGEVADVSDVWCAPTGAAFGADAAVDCVVATRREKQQRERACIGRHNGSGNDEITSSFFEGFSSQFHSGQLRYMQSGHQRYPADYEEMMMFQTRVLLAHDQYRDMRLDVDNMTYEELLELSEKIGYVSTGLREEEIIRNLTKPKHGSVCSLPSQKECKCIICQEEYEVNDEMGRLECGHSYHTYCIKQWLLRKNACPVCKTVVAKS